MKPAPRNCLPFVCVWTQKPGDNTESFLGAFREFFEAHKGHATVTIDHVQQKLPRDSCADPLWQVRCRLHLDSSLSLNQLESLSTAIARQWCTVGRSGYGLSSPLQWLQPDRRLGFWHGFITAEANIGMRFISFGTFAGLNLFAERCCLGGQSTYNDYSVHCTFKHGDRILQVFVELTHRSNCVKRHAKELYQLSMHYSNIFRVVVHDPVGGPTDIFLHLHTLPLFRQMPDISEYPSLNFSRGTRQTRRGQMTVQRTLQIGCTCCTVLKSGDIGGCFVVKLGFSDSHEARRTVGRLSRKCRRTWFEFAPVSTHTVGRDADGLRQRLCERLEPQVGFACCYALNALLQRSDDIAMQLMLLTNEQFEAVVRDLESFAAQNESALEVTLFTIKAALENHSIVTFCTVLPTLFARMCRMYVTTPVPRGSCLVRRVFVTPSHIFYMPPAIHAENRVLRKFDANYALRVSFRDDDLRMLSFSLQANEAGERIVDQVVGSFLRTGLQIGGRHFRLLACSVSQLRDHGVWLYANDPQGNSVESIREWMGDFSTMPNVAKKIARMGQCFSSTEESVPVPLHGEVMQDADDIEGGIHPESGKPYVFSDGIGVISESLMKKVCSKLALAEVPSAIQIRYAGYKGMLCTNNALEGDKLILRKSMNKFACTTSDSLEVVKVSAPSPLFLNRPLITILEQLGVPGRVFVNLQQNMVRQLCDAFLNSETALHVLSTYTSATLPFRKLHLRGMSLSREPFMRSLLLVIYKSLIAGLQEKSRIAIPVDSGRNMLGVLDETGTLEYGQVFVQFTPMSGSGDTPPAKVITGTVLVTKCPCHHPGDVRKFQAVDVPALRHIRDCIVFPARGPRPHPNEMAGSDLDGDEYIVTWEEDLYFPGDNREPMVFSDTSVGAPSTGHLDEDIIQFLCKYILHDSIGMMSNAHLAWADLLDEGIFHPLCLTLAKKISVCLDFAKTGISVSLGVTERPLEYPDFMNKRGGKPTYRSARILGELFRLNKSLVDSSPAKYTTSDFHCALFDYPGWQKHQTAAENAKSAYTWFMAQILNQHGIESEAEVVTGIINSVSLYNRSKEDTASVKALVAKQYRALVAAMQEQFLVDVEAACEGDSDSSDTRTTLMEMASAWYMVTCTDEWQEEGSLGFPWCIPESLLLLMRELNDHSLPQEPLSLLVSKIDTHCTAGPARDVAFDLLCKWAQNEELLRDGVEEESQVCNSCFAGAFEHFVSDNRRLEDKTPETTASGELVSDESATAGNYVSGFLCHLIAAPTQLPVGTECSAASSHMRMLTLAALHCYSRLVISRDVCCFGLSCDADHDWAEDAEECDPIRVSIRSDRCVELVRETPEVVQELLRQWSGVQEVNVRCESHGGPRKKYHYLVVSAVGRLWQLCRFEELVVHPRLEDAIVAGRLTKQ